MNCPTEHYIHHMMAEEKTEKRRLLVLLFFSYSPFVIPDRKG